MAKTQKNKTHYTFDAPFIGGKNILIPSSLKYLARRCFKQFSKQHLALTINSSEGAVNFEKAESLLESWLTRETRNLETGQQPTHALCRFLSPKPFWEATDSTLLANIENLLTQNTQIIAQEFMDVVEANDNGSKKNSLIKNINTGEGFLEKDTWRNVQLGSLGAYSVQMKKLFPKTIALLEPLGKRIFSAEFIVMEADTTLPPHTDATNAYLVAHLGLIVPDNCGLQVKDKVRDFRQGDMIFFDQSFVHSAWNKGESRRVNLLLTVFHPEISDREAELLVEFVNVMQKRALLFSPIIIIEYLFLKLVSFFK